jgi:hypothetical protein
MFVTQWRIYEFAHWKAPQIPEKTLFSGLFDQSNAFDVYIDILEEYLTPDWLTASLRLVAPTPAKLSLKKIT